MPIPASPRRTRTWLRPACQMPRGGSECSHSSCRPPQPRPEPAIGHASPPGRPTRPPRGVRLRAGEVNVSSVLHGHFSPGKIGDVQLTGCSAGALTEPGAQRARKFVHSAFQVRFHAGRVCRPFEQVHDPGRVLRAAGGPKKAASPGPNSYPAAARPSQAAPSCPRPPPCPSLFAPSLARELHRVWRVPLELPYRLVAAAQVSVASRWPCSSRPRKSTPPEAVSWLTECDCCAVTAAPDPSVLCVLAPTRASLSGREGEMARSMRRNGTAYWRALLMALWSLLNPTHPQ